MVLSQSLADWVEHLTVWVQDLQEDKSNQAESMHEQMEQTLHSCYLTPLRPSLPRGSPLLAADCGSGTFCW